MWILDSVLNDHACIQNREKCQNKSKKSSPFHVKLKKINIKEWINLKVSPYMFEKFTQN